MPIIQLISDVHGHWERVNISTEAQLVVALGDMEDGINAINKLKAFNVPVIYVPGNHEYYGGDLGTRLQELKDIARGTQIIVANNETVISGHTRFICSTLWTDHQGMNEQLIAHSLTSLNDYNHIRVEQWISDQKNQQKYLAELRSFEDAYPRKKNLFPSNPLKMNPIIAKILHEKSIHYIYDQLSDQWDGDTVILTHHAPSLSSLQTAGYFTIPNPGKFDPFFKLKNKPYKIGAYANSLDYIFSNFRIELWLHGHIHEGIRYSLHGTDIITNPTGYHESQNNKFKSHLLLKANDTLRHHKILCMTLHDALLKQSTATSIIKKEIIHQTQHKKQLFATIEDFRIFTQIYNQSIFTLTQQQQKDCVKPDFLVELLTINKIINTNSSESRSLSHPQKMRFLSDILSILTSNEKKTKDWLLYTQQNESLNKWIIEGDI